MSKDREVFEAFFKEHYIKRGFISSKDEALAFWQASRAAALEEAKAAIIAEARKQGWGMRNDDPFEESVEEVCVTAIRQLKEQQ